MLRRRGCMSINSGVPQLFCLLDGGRLDSIGRLVTASGETIEIAFCRFDLATSGFRQTEVGRWAPVFVHQHDASRRTSGVTLIDDEPAAGAPRSTEAEIAAALNTFRNA